MLHLLYEFRFHSRISDEIDYIGTHQIKEHLQDSGFPNIQDQFIRSNVIAKLRDKEVIIASSNKGYKIPKCYADLKDFVERVNSQVVPLLDRLRKARESYLLASKGDVDLLKGPRFPNLTAFLEELSSDRNT